MTATYLVNEIYSCLQGEGPNCGKPSLLVRFQVCNLRCIWCDTPYTHTIKSDPVDKNNLTKGQLFKRYTLNELLAKIKEYPQKHLILSGGEPTLHNLGVLLRSLGKEYTGEVESNGTRIPHLQIKNFLASDYSLLQWNISPKFSNSGEKIVPESLNHWSELSKKQQNIFFKFVVRKAFKEADIAEVLDIVDKFSLDSNRIYLMAEGITVESQLANTWLHDECLKYGFNYTPRLHILLFGNKRGV
nr:7-carboxy-7-deazaguanine synthase QueE [Pigmentibacter ruber]